MKPQGKDAGGRKREQTPNHLQSKPLPVQVQKGMHIRNWPLQPPMSMQELTINLPQILAYEESATIRVI